MTPRVSQLIRAPWKCSTDRSETNVCTSNYRAENIGQVSLLGDQSEMEPSPKISIVTPSFNQGQYLEQTIRSVLFQDYPNLDYIVIDGDSGDGSATIISKYSSHLSYWVSEKDSGQADALCKGFSKATGQIQGWVNSDDILLPHTLHAVSNYFVEHPAVGVVYGNRIFIDHNGNETGRQYPPSFVPAACWGQGQQLCQEAVFWRRESYDKVGGINPRWFFIMDFDLFYRMSRIARFAKLRRHLGCMRVHPDTKSARHDPVMWSEFELAKRSLGIEGKNKWITRAAQVLAKQLSRVEKVLADPFSKTEYERWRDKLKAS